MISFVSTSRTNPKLKKIQETHTIQLLQIKLSDVHFNLIFHRVGFSPIFTSMLNSFHPPSGFQMSS